MFFSKIIINKFGAGSKVVATSKITASAGTVSTVSGIGLNVQTLIGFGLISLSITVPISTCILCSSIGENTEALTSALEGAKTWSKTEVPLIVGSIIDHEKVKAIEDAKSIPPISTYIYISKLLRVPVDTISIGISKITGFYTMYAGEVPQNVESSPEVLPKDETILLKTTQESILPKSK